MLNKIAKAAFFDELEKCGYYDEYGHKVSGAGPVATGVVAGGALGLGGAYMYARKKMGAQPVRDALRSTGKNMAVAAANKATVAVKAVDAYAAKTGPKITNKILSALSKIKK